MYADGNVTSVRVYTRDRASLIMNKVGIENAASIYWSASARIGCKQKVRTRDGDTPSKKKCDGSKKTVVRHALNECTKESMLAVLRKAVRGRTYGSTSIVF